MQICTLPGKENILWNHYNKILLPSPFSLGKVEKFMFDSISLIDKDLYILVCIVKFDKIIN